MEQLPDGARDEGGVSQPEPPAAGTATKSNPSPVADEVDIEYRVYPTRWFALAALMLLMISSSTAWNSFAPVAERAAEYYGTTTATINWMALDMYLCFVVTGLLSSYIIDTRGLRVAFLIASVFTCLGLWTRYLGTLSPDRHTALAVGFLGQTLCGLGRPFGTASTTRLASTWFGMSERTFANAVASVSPSAGVLLASAATPYIVSEPSKMPTALLIWACVSVVPLVMAVFMPAKPPTPPSPSANVMKATTASSVEKWKISLRTAVTNKDYIVLWIMMSGQLCLFFIYVVLVSSVMGSYGYSAQQAGFVTVAVIACGWLSTPIAKIVDRTGGWVPAMRALLILTTGAFVGLTLSLRPGLYPAILVCAGVFGFVSTPVLPIVFELGTPAMSQYLFYSVGCLIAVIAVPLLANVQNKTIVFWVLVGVSGLTALLGLLYRGKTKRRLHETTVLEKQQVEKALRDLKVDQNKGDEGPESHVA
ncbi:major facilitator superfamily domain-containing protein [Hyaloraphidium curvatum]|nr:major facilitator superfamily domain-containing protein [Hyaloraphidium curvatum]